MQRVTRPLACVLLVAASLAAGARLARADEAKHVGASHHAGSPSRTAAAEHAEPPESPYLARAFIFVDSPQIDNYLRGVAKRLLDASNVQMTLPNVLIESSDAFNFFTDSRQNLIVSTGALRAIASEDELAAVLGHELSHLILKHPQHKDAINAVPVGIETLGFVNAAASQLGGSGSRRGSGGATGGANAGAAVTKAGEPRLANAQAVSLLWTDIIAPSWNRSQERAADERGFELMRTAGYDPSAFGRLYQRLHDAEVARSQRMELLQKIVLARVQAKEKPSTTPTRTSTSAMDGVSDELSGLGAKVTAVLTEHAVDAVFKGITYFSRQYDSPDVRQQNLAKYAHDHRLQGRPPAHPAVHFRDTLRSGTAGYVLHLDAAAIHTLDALNGRDPGKASAAIAPLLSAATSGELPSAHLNLALGSFQQANARTDLAEKHARAWLAGRRPPAEAYLWAAYYPATRKEYAAAIDTVERGRSRVGAAAPFLPNLVTLARLAGREKRAEQYALECQAEDRKSATNVVTALFQGSRIPSGLYGDCVQRLGHEPKQDGGVMNALRSPVQTTKDIAGKIRDKFRSNDN